MMKEPVIDEVEARKFLLGQLSPEEQGQIEELAFADPDTLTFLESVEEDLIDDFLQDELSALEKQRFNDHFLSFPGRRQDLQISEVLQQHFNPVPAEVITAEPQEREVVHDDDDGNVSFFARVINWFKLQSFWLQATTAAAVGGLLIAVWVIPDREERQPDPVQAGSSTPVNVPSPEPRISPSLDPAPSPVPTENKRKSPTPEKQKPKPTLEKQTSIPVYATLLPSAVQRGSGGQSLRLSPDGSSMRLGLALLNKKNFKTYDVTLENEAGREIDRWPNLAAQPLSDTQRVSPVKGLVIDLPGNLLKPDEFYRFVVTGVSATGEKSILHGYSFEARK